VDQRTFYGWVGMPNTHATWYISEIVLSDGRTVSIREIETKTGQPPTRPASMTGL
jgi:hypothetical protein